MGMMVRPDRTTIHTFSCVMLASGLSCSPSAAAGSGNAAPHAQAAFTATCLLQTEAVALSRLGKVYDKVRTRCRQSLARRS